MGLAAEPAGSNRNPGGSCAPNEYSALTARPLVCYARGGAGV